jgi:hypothetical protein
MVFQPIRCTASGIAAGTGELLPPLFTLIPLSEAEGDGYFLLHFYTLTDIFPLGSMVPCVVRTFLPALSEAEERDDGTACCTAKVVNPDKWSIVSEIDIFVYKIAGSKV